ncbi:hypothetical protein OS493_018204 [Desmophyllum pertusum]|uniref:Uncharacterized protein n=1 Tax=Desmophyllum pertusum TaxID=174260 RepID=A0A9W9YBS5_9CNID|nr:hypothetical protein OS493_018204 [Desmophyllum pertusum]
MSVVVKKNSAQAEELEKKIFGSRRIGVGATTEHRQNRASGEEVLQQANETLNNGHVATAGTQPQAERGD